MYTNYPFMLRPNILGKTASLSKGFNWASLLDGTQKTLGVINQAIPIVHQVKPIVNNAKTMFKIADALKTDTIEIKEPTKNITPIQNDTPIKNQPIFYI